MKFVYIANARMPTEKAHGIAIMKACEAFARSNMEVTLVVARRRHEHSSEDPHTFYGIREPFRIVRLPSLDLNPLPGWFWIQSISFYLALFVWGLFGSRVRIIYTREAPALLLSMIGYRTFLECHVVPERRTLYFWLARHARGIVTVARSLKGFFIKAGFAETCMHVEPNAVDLSVFDLATEKAEARQALNLSEQAFLMVYTGNFTTRGMEKGLADSLRALSKLPEGFELIAVGGSADDLKRYHALAQELDVGSRTHLIGYKPQRVLALYQKAADALLMPFPDTPYYRTHMSPLKLFEYAASRRPIVASDLPTIREVLDESAAVIVSPDSANALADAIQSLAHDPLRGKQLAQAAYENIAKSHTWDSRAKRISNFLESCQK
jgi:glycosyltransferase involved in cell wall biosynthesis